MNKQYLSIIAASFCALLFQNCSDVKFSNSNLEKLNDGLGLCPANYILSDFDNLCYPIEDIVTEKSPSMAGAVDLFFIIDDSGSMTDEKAGLRDSMGNFAADLQNKGIDWQACYSTTGTLNNSNRGDARTWVGLGSGNAGDLLLASTMNVLQIFADTMNSFTYNGSSSEEGIRAANYALANNPGCFRENVASAFIILSDEDECSTGTCTSDVHLPTILVENAAKKFSSFQFHSIVIKPDDTACKKENEDQGHKAYYGTYYAAASALTNGILGSICYKNQDDSTKYDYSSQLSTVATSIEQSFNTVSLECSPLNGLISVKVGGMTLASDKYTLNGNAVTFNPPLTYSVRLEYKCVDTSANGVNPAKTN